MKKTFITFGILIASLVPALATPPDLGLDDAQRQAIDRAIQERGLNQYGDPADTMYTGGTPLFDERTGQSVDRYQYILKNHPDLGTQQGAPTPGTPAPAPAQPAASVAPTTPAASGS